MAVKVNFKLAVLYIFLLSVICYLWIKGDCTCCIATLYYQFMSLLVLRIS